MNYLVECESSHRSKQSACMNDDGAQVHTNNNVLNKCYSVENAT